MGRLVIAIVCCFGMGSAKAALAQGSDPASKAAPSTATVVTEPPSGYSRAPDAFELEEAERRSRVVRNALIGTSAGFALGVVFAGVGASQCERIDRFDDNNDWTCNTAGDVLVSLGATFLGLGAIGMLTTGIMLGVRNRDKRRLEQQLRRRSGSRLRWDARTGAFTF